MGENQFWNLVDDHLSRNQPYIQSEKGLRQKEIQKFRVNVDALKDILQAWKSSLEKRGFQVAVDLYDDGLKVTYRKEGYFGPGGFASVFDATGRLVAGVISPGSGNGFVYRWSNDPDKNMQLGNKFSVQAFMGFLQELLLTYVDERNLVLTLDKQRELRSRRFASFRTRYEKLAKMKDRQRAGRELEPLLNDLFLSNGLIYLHQFRLVGEQIDGAFVLDGETYLVEAKWHHKGVGRKELDAFDKKIERKTHVTRGMFLSIHGITAGARESISTGNTPRYFIMLGCEPESVLKESTTLVDLLRIRRLCWTSEGKVLPTK